VTGGVHPTGGSSVPIRLGPNLQQPQPGVRPILGNRRVESASCCGPRNPVLRALRYLGGLLSRAFAAVMPCGARSDSALTPERAAERTRRNHARVISLERTAVKMSLRAAIELIGRRGTDDQWIQQSILDVAREARRRCSKLQQQGLVADVDAAVRGFMAHAADGDFDKMVEEQVNRGWPGVRALRLLKELRGPQRIVRGDRALGDTEWLRQRLEATVSDAIVKREINIIKKNFRAAAPAVGGVVGTRRQAAEIAQRFNEVTQDGLERCRKLKKQGLITDVNATLLACMPADMREFMARRTKGKGPAG
jgi:hypothetical protein